MRINLKIALCLALLIFSVNGSLTRFREDLTQGILGSSLYTLPSSPRLTFYIENALFEQADFMNELAISCQVNISDIVEPLIPVDCSDFSESNFIEPNSIYFMSINKNDHSISYMLCNPGSNLLAVVQVNLIEQSYPKPQVRGILPLLIDRIQGSNGEYCRSRKAKVMHGSANSSALNLLNGLSCNPNIQRKLSTFQEDYENSLSTCKNVVTCAVISMSSRTSLTVAEYDNLAKHLYDSTQVQVFTQLDYKNLLTAVVRMLSTTLDISETTWNQVFSCLNAFKQVTDAHYFNEDDNNKIILATYNYLLKFYNKLELLDPAYIEKLRVTTTLINSYFLKFLAVKNLSVPFSSYASSSESSRLIRVDYAMRLRDYIPESPAKACICLECSTFNVLAEIAIRYADFGLESPVFSLGLFKIGTIDSKGMITYSEATVLNISSENCFSNTYNLVVNYKNFYGWDCIQISGTNPCEHISNSRAVVQLVATRPGIYLLVASCAINQQYSSAFDTCGTCLVAHCSSCSFSGVTKCGVCRPSYFLTNNYRSCSKCLNSSRPTANQLSCGCKTMKNCYTCSNDLQTCESCYSEYVLNIAGTGCGCFNMQNCYKCSNDLQSCELCYSGYVLNIAGTGCGCFDIQNCDICNYDMMKCDHCINNNVPSVDKLSCGCSIISNCRSCSSTDKERCAICTAPYKLSQDKLSCGCSAIPNCAVCDNNNSSLCLSCTNSYTISSDRLSCVCRAIPNCEVYDDSNPSLCQTCAASYIISTDRLSCSCNAIPNCEVCNNTNTSKCLSCMVPYVNSIDNLSCMKTNIPVCDICDIATNQCGDCRSKEYVKANPNKCRCISIKNCRVCDFKMHTCQKCVLDYKLNADKTFCGCSTDQYCVICHENDYCSVCKTGYFPDRNGLCISGYYCYQDSYLVSFAFDEKYTSLILTLNTPIVYKSSRSCSSYFVDADILGVDATCELISGNKEMIINLGIQFSIRPGSGLTLKDTLTMAEGISSPSCSEKTLLVAAGGVVSVHAALSGPNTISFGCIENEYVLYSSTSYGIGQSTFQYSWRVNNVPQETTEQAFKLKLNTIQYFEIVKLELTVTNFFGVVNTTSLQVAVMYDPQVSFMLNTGQNAEFKLSSPVKLILTNSNFCNIRICSIKYDWEIEQNGKTSEFQCAKFSIPSNSLNVGTLGISINLRTSSPGIKSRRLAQTTPNANTIISAVNSPLVAIMNKFDQDISSLTPLIISGLNSYDPDKKQLTYSWSINNKYTFYGVPDLTVSLTGLQISNKFTVELMVSEGGRMKKTSSTLTLKAINFNLSIDLKIKKFPVSKLNNITATVDCGPCLDSAAWTIEDGPPLNLIKIKDLFVVIRPNTMTAGMQYKINLVVKANIQGRGLQTASAVITISANKPAQCIGSTNVDPNEGTITTKFAAYIDGCSDQDSEDTPLIYYLSYYKNGAPTRLLTSYINTFTNFPLNLGVKKLAITVCDQLNDCNTYDSTTITVTRAKNRSLQDAQSIIDELNQLLHQYDIHFAIYTIFNNHEGLQDEAIINQLWDSFKGYIVSNLNYKIEELIEQQTISSVCLFLPPNQSAIELSRLNFLLQILSGYKVIYPETRRVLIDMARNVIKPELPIDTLLIVHEIISKVLTVESLPDTEDSIDGNSFSAFRVETYKQYLATTEHDLGYSSIIFNNGFKASDSEILRIEAYAYSTDIIHFKATRYTAGENKIPSSTTWYNDSVKFIVGGSYTVCQKLNGANWELTADCYISSLNGNLASMTILSNGFYRVLSS